MANSRLERLGTILSRVTSLMKCGAMDRKDKPLWYEVYQAYPPIDEPSFARRIVRKEIKPILYPEDKIRAKFHQGNYLRSIKIETLEGGVTTSDITRTVITLTSTIMKKEPNLSIEDALERATNQLKKSEEFTEDKSKSMFKPVFRKPKRTSTVEMVNAPKQIKLNNFKDISQKDIDISTIATKHLEKLDDDDDSGNIRVTKNSAVKDFKDACKEMSDSKLNSDDDSKKK